MESNEIQIECPLFFPCTLKEFNDLNKQANELLGFPEGGTEKYAKPLIDDTKQVYFIVNSEVSSLVDLNKCVTFDKLTFKQQTI